MKLKFALLFLLTGCAVKKPVSQPKPEASVPETVIAVVAEPTANLVDGNCYLCLQEQQKSTVILDTVNVTHMVCAPGMYDEAGVYHKPGRCNTLTVSGWCSRGHRIEYHEEVY
jgi:hypothetical protein